ncbi:putative inactive leucine-rich repeat receptor kinase XIAO [Vitis vinifera]|uniref:Putative inactive leucine-rich repeat receptor kinase XIAO n=1 Tax=Vitis vinifera TaxID=29760 RepID=A0A438BRA0_VITVI|nr:putative inactive leucine-rich repeat receptor kinase XIAO [Vitis vinifera]
MRNSRPIILIPLLCFLSTISILCDPNTLVCNEKEKHALLRFKQALYDPGNRLSSWSINQDCCRWEEVRCNNVTGRVVELHLGNPYDIDYEFYSNFDLGGEISPALLELEFLSYLNLSWNDFGGRPIPSFLGSMGSLRYLDLSFAGFGGLVPHQLGNLSTLRYLDLGYRNGMYVDNLGWISHLTFLKYLGMNQVDLHKEVHWLESVSMFPSLSELHLSDCELDSNMPSSLGYANFTSLTFLDLSWNNLNQEIPNWLFNLSSLVSLSLSQNQFKGQISESLGQLKYLKYLGLDGNPINGTLPMSLWLLSNLEYLNVGWTSLTGTISEVHFTALSKLKVLSISGTSLSFHVNSSWTPPFQLEYLEAYSCKMGPKFPAWLQTQKSLVSLDLSRSGIVDTAPNWFWKFASYIYWIHLSNNQISGDLSQVVLNNTIIDLSSNCFSGRLPHLSPNVVVLNIANNSFSGKISPFMCQKMNGRSKLEVLDISINALSGELSDCWMHWPSLTHVSLGNNNLSGKIPNSMGSLVGLKALSLQNNSFFGDIHSSLENCKVLGLINLSDNKFLGIIPSLSGSIPKCLNNISAMAAGPIRGIWYDALEVDDGSYMESLVLDIKGRESKYGNILKYVRMIDLSSNNLSGSIPIEISSLFGLQFLNLSRNHLMGRIPEKIGVMASLESLDLSRNHLSGEIPQSMSNLTFLDHLDLSFNNFSGRIPSSTQLQSFDPLSFFGNPELCGAPLTKNCTKDEETLGPTAVEENREFPEIAWFYIGMGSGFIVGFWGVCGALFFKRAWRHAYFQFLYDMRDRAYVAIPIKLKWFHQKLRRYHAGKEKT